METVATELAYAKLTRTLEVLGLRADGYHLLRSEMVTVSLADRVVIGAGSSLDVRDAIPWTAPAGRRPTLEIPRGGDNLVVRALDLIGARASIRLDKRIAAGAGLGGGSADAAAVLRHFGVCDPSRAARLGADVPFCLIGGRANVTGIGETIEPLSFEPLSFVLVTPGISVPTAAVYRAFDEVGRGAFERNQLSAAAFSIEPRLAHWREWLTRWTGCEPTLAGSGSSFFYECSPTTAATWADQIRLEVENADLTAAVVTAHAVPGRT